MPSISPRILPRILVLGGTIEGRLLGERLAKRTELDVTLSLAGRTAARVPHAVPVRVGGFGGPEGLAAYLIAEGIDAMIDATHPYATVISDNAAAAAHRAKVPLVALRRPPWLKTTGDRWTEVENVADAVSAIGETPRNVFVALGRNELTPFSSAPQHRYLFRSVDPIDPPLPLPQANYVTARGPFSEADDRALMAVHAIDVVIAKNSGGTAAYGKIAAARALGVDVILLRRPPELEGPTVTSIEEAVAWLDHTLTSAAMRGV